MNMKNREPSFNGELNLLPVNQINEINNVIKRTLENKDKYTKEITDLLNNNVYNLGSSSEKGATYIIKIIQKKIS